MNVLLLATYEMGRQPFGLASPAAWLARSRATRFTVCDLLAADRLTTRGRAQARLVACYVPMHTATRLLPPVVTRVRLINPRRAAVRLRALRTAERAHDLRALGFDVGPRTGVRGGAGCGPSGACRWLGPRAPGPTIAAPMSGAAAADVPCAGSHRAAATRALRRAARRRRAPRWWATRRRRAAASIVAVTARSCRSTTDAFASCTVDVVIEDVAAAGGAGRASHHLRRSGLSQRAASRDGRRRRTSRARLSRRDLRRHDQGRAPAARTPDLLPRLRDTGCLFVTSAVESLDDDVLARLEKGHTRRDVERAWRSAATSA